MAETRHRAHLNMLGNRIIAALLDPQATDPGSPEESQIWVNTTTDRVMIRLGGTDMPLAFLSDVTGGSITGALWNAQSVVVAVADDTPQAVIVPEDGVVGRLAGGNIGAVTAAQLKTMLSIPAGTLASETYVTNAINAVLDGAPAALDTLNELATALQDNDSDIAGLLSAIDGKVSSYAADIGGATTVTVSHSLGTEDVVVSARTVADNTPEILSWEPVSTSAIEVAFNAAPAASSIRVVVQG